MKKLFTVLAVLSLLLMYGSLAFAYPKYVASPMKVFDDGAVPQDLALIGEFKNSFLEGFPSPSYQNISREFDDYFGGTRWWNYDKYNVVMAGLTYSNGRESRIRISFYKEGNEPVWISYVQVDGDIVYRWNEKYNRLNLEDLLHEVYAFH